MTYPSRRVSVFFNDTATTEIYTLSLHDALPILGRHVGGDDARRGDDGAVADRHAGEDERLVAEPHVAPDDGVDRKSTRLNSSHANISYAVFCLKNKTTS